MKRLILSALIGAVALFPAIGSAATTKQTEWALKTSADAAEAQNRYCVIEQTIKNAPHLSIAQNLIGQYSLIADVGDNFYQASDKINARLSVPGQAERTVSGFASSKRSITLPLGWDSGVIGALKDQSKLSINTGKKSHYYNLPKVGAQIGLLASCTASLLERNPDSSALPQDVRAITEKAGMQNLHLVQFSNASKQDQKQVFTWVDRGLFGGVDVAPVKDNATLDTLVLNYMDRLEKLCRGQFTSDFSPPVENGKNRFTSDAIVSCAKGNSTSVSALVFMQDKNKSYVFYSETDAVNKDKAVMQKQALLGALRS